MDKKQSLILGALTSSAGIFVTKLLGIFYMVPFTALAGEANLTYYSYAYGVYQELLEISLAGLPYAVATLVAKYALKEDYKAVDYIKKLTTGIMLGFGFICCAIMFIGAGPIARYITPDNITPENLQKAKNVMMIISFAFFTVPLLSGVRGYFQGLKDMKLYAFSQVLEQFSRITFLLTVAFVTVSLLKLDGIYAVYGAVGSAFVSSFVALIHLYISRKKKFNEMKKLADDQKEMTISNKDLTKELIWIAIPYLITTVLGNSLNICNTTFFSSAMDMAGYPAETTSLLYSMINLTTSKMTSIPHFLATGFSVAVIPYLTTSVEKKDIEMCKKYILDAIDSVIYLGLPLCFYLFAIGTEIYYVMYGARTSYQLGGEVLRWASISAVLGTVSPVINSLTMAVRLRKQNILFMAIGFASKFITFFPLIILTGYSGAITSSAVCSCIIISLDLWALNKHFGVSYKGTFTKLARIVVGLLAMQACFLVLNMIGLKVTDKSRFIALIELAVYGGTGLIAYIGVTAFLKVPQEVFHLQNENVFAFLANKFTRRFRK